MIKNRLFIIFLAAVGVTFIVHACRLAASWISSDKIYIGSQRAYVVEVLGEPSQQRAKASNLDIWNIRALFGGVQILVNYGGDNCSIELSTDCHVISLDVRYFTVWGNTAFLSYAKHVHV